MRTRSPVQNIGHSYHGGSLASPSQVLKYGLRTINGRTGGVSLEAWADKTSADPAAAAAATVSQRMVEEMHEIIVNYTKRSSM